MRSDLPETTKVYGAIREAALDNFGVVASHPRSCYDGFVTFDYQDQQFVVSIVACRDVWHTGGGFKWSGRWNLKLENDLCEIIAISRPLDRNVEVAARRLMKEVRRFLAWKAGHFRPRLVVDNTVSV